MSITRGTIRSTARTREGLGARREPKRAPLSVVVFACDGSPAERRLSKVGSKRRLSPDSPSSLIQEIRVPCSGKLQPEHFLKAFEMGADLVLVATCRDGDCRYLEGQRRVRRRVDYVKRLLDEIGLGGGRIVVLESPAGPNSETHGQPDAIREALAAAAAGLEPSPLGRERR